MVSLVMEAVSVLILVFSVLTDDAILGDSSLLTNGCRC